MYRERIVRVTQDSVTIDNQADNRLSEADFYGALEAHGSTLYGKWAFALGTVSVTVDGTRADAVWNIKANLARLGICVGDQQPYIFTAERVN